MAIDQSRAGENEGSVSIDSIADLFRFYSSNGEIQKVRQLHQDTGTPPPEDAIQQLYRVLLERIQASTHSKANISHLDNIERLLEETGIQANVGEELVQTAYGKILSTSYSPHGADTLLRATRVKPSEKIVQNAYVDLLKGYHFDRFVSLVTATSIKLPDDYARETALGLMKNQLYHLRSFIEVTGVKLPEDQVLNQFAFYASNGRLDKAKVLRKATGITPHEDEFRRAINAYLTRSNSGRRTLEPDSTNDPRDIAMAQRGRLDRINDRFNAYISGKYVRPSEQVLTEAQNYISQNIFNQKK